MTLFSDHAPFSLHPSEDELPTAALERVSLAKLISGDGANSDKVFKACRTVGFFAVDLQDHEDGKALIKSADEIFKLSHELFALDIEQKRAFASPRERPLLGYKAVGLGKLDQKGTPDCVEIFGISKDDILRQSAPGSALPEPPPVKARRDQIETFMLRCHSLTDLVSSHLERQLGFPKGALVVRQRLQALSGNQLRLTKTATPAEQKDVSFMPHTDLGCVTVLFNILGGLQILPEGGDAQVQGDWRYVRPEPGCAIINLGDAMVKWTNGILRSNMHRVAFPPGKQAELSRYSIAYFSRPESQALMEALGEGQTAEGIGQGDGPSLNAADWEREKAMALYRDPSILKSLGGVGS